MTRNTIDVSKAELGLWIAEMKRLRINLDEENMKKMSFKTFGHSSGEVADAIERLEKVVFKRGVKLCALMDNTIEALSVARRELKAADEIGAQIFKN